MAEAQDRINDPPQLLQEQVGGFGGPEQIRQGPWPLAVLQG